MQALDADGTGAEAGGERREPGAGAAGGWRVDEGRRVAGAGAGDARP